MQILHESRRDFDVRQAHSTVHKARLLIHQNAFLHDLSNSTMGKQLAPSEQEGVHCLLLSMQAVIPSFSELREFFCGLQEAIAEVPQMAWTQQGFHSTNPKALTKIHGSFLAEIIYHLKTWFRNNGE